MVVRQLEELAESAKGTAVVVHDWTLPAPLLTALHARIAFPCFHPPRQHGRRYLRPHGHLEWNHDLTRACIARLCQ
jgi:hypothetical protein